MQEFDITGFVNFPGNNVLNIKKIETGRTFIYLVAAEYTYQRGLDTEHLSRISIDMNGNYMGDDISPKNNLITSNCSVNDIVSLIKNQSENHWDNNISFISCVLIGWSNYSYQLTDNLQTWVCSFRELTEEGRKLYYSFKKLHYNNDIRILTFNNINYNS